MFVAKRAALLLLSACALCACQSPTDPNQTIQLLDVTVSPDPATATTPTGRFYTVTHTNEPDERREYDWHATFSVSVKLREDATNSNLGIDLPFKVTSATLAVQQASGGIVTPPTGGETERYEFVISNSTSNEFPSIGSTVTTTFEVWYHLPNLRREALVNVTLGFADNDTYRYTQVIPVKVAP